MEILLASILALAWVAVLAVVFGIGRRVGYDERRREEAAQEAAISPEDYGVGEPD